MEMLRFFLWQTNEAYLNDQTREEVSKEQAISIMRIQIHCATDQKGRHVLTLVNLTKNFGL